MQNESKKDLKMDPKSMPNPTKGGQGPPQGAPGGDFDSFWSARRTSRGPKKGVRKMDRKMDPHKIDFWRFLDRDGADPGGVCGWHLGLKLTNSNSCSARPAPRRGRRIQVQSLRALRQARGGSDSIFWGVSDSSRRVDHINPTGLLYLPDGFAT